MCKSDFLCKAAWTPAPLDPGSGLTFCRERLPWSKRRNADFSRRLPAGEGLEKADGDRLLLRSDVKCLPMDARPFAQMQSRINTDAKAVFPASRPGAGGRNLMPPRNRPSRRGCLFAQQSAQLAPARTVGRGQRPLFPMSAWKTLTTPPRPPPCRAVHLPSGTPLPDGDCSTARARIVWSGNSRANRGMDEAGSPAWPGTNTVSTRIGKKTSLPSRTTTGQPSPRLARHTRTARSRALLPCLSTRQRRDSRHARTKRRLTPAVHLQDPARRKPLGPIPDPTFSPAPTRST